MKLSKIRQFVENLFLPLLLLFSGFTIILEYINGTNYILNNFHFDYVDLFAVSTVLFGISAISKPKKFYEKHWKKLIFILPVFLILLAMVINMRYNTLFFYLEAEDSVIEWLQFLLISAISALNFILFRKYKNRDKMLATIFFIAFLGFFVVAAEEISWGQRIFDLKTPEEYAKVNLQQELTLHNYGTIFGYVYRAYMIFGLVASTAFMIRSTLLKYLPKFTSVWKIMIPGWQYFIYFFTAFAYNYDRFYLRPEFRVIVWEEPMELLLFIGIFIFFIEVLLKSKKVSKKK